VVFAGFNWTLFSFLHPEGRGFETLSAHCPKSFPFRLLHRTMAGVPVVRLLDAALDWMEKRRAPKTYAWYKNHLNSFAASIDASLSVADLKPLHVTKKTPCLGTCCL
jgi:hypothetical protein